MKRKRSVYLFGFLSLLAPFIFPQCSGGDFCPGSLFIDGDVGFCF